MRATLFAMIFSVWTLSCGVAPGPADETEEIISNLTEAGFPSDDIMVSGGAVYVGRDTVVTLDASREMLQTDSDTREQYRTTNVISRDVKWIKIRVPASAPATIRTGLNEAMKNFNDLKLSFEFMPEPIDPCDRVPPPCPGTGIMSTIDMVINPASPGGGGSSGGAPSNGLPYPRFSISSSIASSPINTIEHVITHELGHVVGLRHSDFYNRSISCGGSAVNEGSAGVGAVLIPGTPNSATAGGSIMNSCIPTGSTGEFTSSDITALTYLYGTE
ncbi:protease B [Corallococcus coralloides DSM 2259]|uniref:Protease B n=1 Tax=Corallococcus coralloides (strain ATCC 25202 / DSM 2259 / NBRC 100086 / M2) TaxID=1144275 RepID=H8MGT9_CORCM|nr:M57 family metalloprotease [Corallococcus coralloides]AFE05896.1 protease B [Corallococcus coralloides DSM 2259]